MTTCVSCERVVFHVGADFHPIMLAWRVALLGGQLVVHALGWSDSNALTVDDDHALHTLVALDALERLIDVRHDLIVLY